MLTGSIRCDKNIAVETGSTFWIIITIEDIKLTIVDVSCFTKIVFEYKGIITNKTGESCKGVAVINTIGNSLFSTSVSDFSVGIITNKTGITIRSSNLSISKV